MPSIIPNYEYDIFISYRQKDNRSDQWVTKFVKAIKEELDATFKEDVSIYFDENSHDGLHEHHEVDGSLKDKLKCLILIPIISQTYCDPKCFAWEHEFLVFVEQAGNDQFGLKTKLAGGNVANRILPVKIHDLDTEDTKLFESEVGGVMRSIDFIYSEASVNRPLMQDDSKGDNLNKTNYRNQINKVANAIKEIIAGLKNVGTESNENEIASSASNPISQSIENKSKSKRKVLLTSMGLILILAIMYFFYQKKNNSEVIKIEIDKSIAVLPFVDLSPEGDQEYLGDGIAEEIINVLTKIDGLKVIGRTSSFSFKDQNTDLMTIGNKLGVGTILGGSVRKSNNRIRITAQLINAEDGSHLWSETFERELEDIFALQDDISTWIVDKFKLTLTLSREETPPTRNIDAYEMYLKGRQYVEKGLIGTEKAAEYFEKAIQLDPLFLSAYIKLSDQYWKIGLYGLGEANTFNLKAKNISLKAIDIAPESYLGYLKLSFLNFSVDWDWEEASTNYSKAVSLGMPSPQPLNALYQVVIYDNNDLSITIMEEVLKHDPLSVSKLMSMGRMYYYAGRYDDVLINAEKVLEINPENTDVHQQIGVAHLNKGDEEKALVTFENLLQINSSFAPYGYVGALVKLGRGDEARTTFNQLSSSLSSLKKALCYIPLNELDSVFKYLDKAYVEKDIWMPFIKADPNFNAIKWDPRYQDLVEKMNFPEE